MEEKKVSLFSEIEKDTLQELMNISFGKAAADLAEVIDAFIKLNVPEINVIHLNKLSDYINSVIKICDMDNIVEQHYYGEIKGAAYLTFPAGSGNELFSYFYDKKDDIDPDMQMELNNEVLMEIGNILIGACVGKIFELLNSSVAYFPPRIIDYKDFQNLFNQKNPVEKDYSITLKTNFIFEEKGVSGYMFLINNQESVPFLKKALSKFMSQFKDA